MTVEDLATQYAFDSIISSCVFDKTRSKTEQIDEVLNKWSSNQSDDSVTIWDVFENHNPSDLFDIFINFQAAFKFFAQDLKAVRDWP